MTTEERLFEFGGYFGIGIIIGLELLLLGLNFGLLKR